MDVERSAFTQSRKWTTLNIKPWNHYTSGLMRIASNKGNLINGILEEKKICNSHNYNTCILCIIPNIATTKAWVSLIPLLIFLSFHSNVSHILPSNKGAWYINVTRNHVATSPIKTTQFDLDGPMLHQTTKPNGWMDLVICYITLVGVPMDALTSYFWLPINYLKTTCWYFLRWSNFYFFIHLAWKTTSYHN